MIAAVMAAMAAQVQFTHAQTTLTYVEDFEGEFPGPQGIWGSGYSFHGGALADPAVVEEVVATGFNSAQSYQISIDATNNIGEGSWGWYYGLGSFPRFSGGTGDGAAQGQTGQDDPANFSIQFDLKVAGATNQSPVRGEIALYRPDYEAHFNVDLNMDGDMTDGFDTWVAGFGVPNQADNYTDWHHVTLNLAQINAPTAPAPVSAPLFDDESTFVLRAFWGAGEYGIDAGNVINFDNVALVFTPPATLSGDFNGDSKVDGADFLKWQRGESPNPLSQGDLDLWKSGFGAGGAVGSIGAVPEPASALLTMGGLVPLAALVRSRRRARA
jgi:hypothetical protein